MSTAPMPGRPTADDPPALNRSRDEARLRAIVRLLIIVAVLFGCIEAVIGAVVGTFALVLAGVSQALFGIVLAILWDRRRRDSTSHFILQLCAALLIEVVLVAWLVPSIAGVLRPAALIPVAIAIPYVRPDRLRSVMSVAWALSVGVSILAESGRQDTILPEAMSGLFRIVGGATVIGILLILMYNDRSRLSDQARELAALVTLSRDLSDTLDPKQIAERLARHLAEATSARACVISSLDRTTDAVTTFASYPPDEANYHEGPYLLADYPATRAVIENREPAAMHLDDPDIDPSEAALMRAEGNRALVMLPLVARGETVGLIELVRGSDAFDERDVALASTFVAEAAMALDNSRLYQELRHQAFHDGLTKLPNRALFNDRLEHALARSSRQRFELAVLFIDVDDFKTVNDRHGHAKGDQLLTAVADRLRSAVRAGDTVARVGGDEFVVLIEDLETREEAERAARRILGHVSQPLRLDDAELTLSVSIGIAFAEQGADTADTLLRNADFAMYQAKARGKARTETFRDDMRSVPSERHDLELLLQGAIERNELVLQFQPVVRLTTGRITGAEALVRWDPPGRPRMMPADFIPLAEDSGLIVPIGRWVLNEACRQGRAWQRYAGTDELTVSVNLSAKQFQNPALRSDIETALAVSGLSPSSLIVEITESVLMQHTPTTVATLEGLRALGVRVAMDDFGTGYSSLSYLQRFPVDILKVDRSFVEGAATGKDGAVLAKAIVALGRALHMTVVAEGIEDVEQLRILRSFGCGYGQGYLFSQPVDALDLTTLLGTPDPFHAVLRRATREPRTIARSVTSA